eukprot:GHRR01026884.1.p1 GENE.GHRR01026884.1~~GHRR01026884.1.p1  ORF type:complete len:126 (+),score=32.55 GHRR01026884.1:263-640(+)
MQINCGSIAPITASQFGTNRFMERLLTQRTGQELSSLGRFGCAAVAGTVSALVASPTELIIIQQQVSSQLAVLHMLLHAHHCSLSAASRQPCMVSLAAFRWLFVLAAVMRVSLHLVVWQQAASRA